MGTGDIWDSEYSTLSNGYFSSAYREQETSQNRDHEVVYLKKFKTVPTWGYPLVPYQMVHTHITCTIVIGAFLENNIMT